MTAIGRTLLRFAGALLLGAGATSIDNPRLLFAPSSSPTAKPVVAEARPDINVTPIEITPGKRAMALRINDISGIVPLIQPGNRVDILFVPNDPAQSQVAKLLMEDVRVLAAGSVQERTENGRLINTAVASLEVTPDEGERLATATSQGSIQLMLRGREATDPHPPVVPQKDSVTVRR